MTQAPQYETNLLIGELSECTGASVRSLRHYEKVGLLVAARYENGYRSFRPEDVERVRRIRTLLSVGLSLADILELSPCLEKPSETPFLCAEAAQLYQAKLAEVEARLRDLEKARDLLLEHVRAVEAASGNL